MLRRYSQVLIIVVILAGSVMAFGGWKVMTDKPPIPDEVVTPDGEILFAEEDIRGGQAVRFGGLSHLPQRR